MAYTWFVCIRGVMVFRSWVSVVVVEMGAVCDRGGVEVAVVFARVVRLLGDARLVVGSMVMTVGTAGVDDPSWLCQHGCERRHCRVQWSCNIDLERGCGLPRSCRFRPSCRGRSARKLARVVAPFSHPYVRGGGPRRLVLIVRERP